jgi:DNA-binding NarL/FixJ family response regulator
MGPVRVLIVDDHALFAKTLAAVLAGDPWVEVVGTASDGQEAVSLTAMLQPDVVVMDLQMPVMDGFAATAQISERGLASRVLVLTASRAGDDEERSREAGAVGFLTKDRIVGELQQAILAAYASDTPSSRSSASFLSSPPA